MPEEKRDQNIVKRDELSDQQLDQASGGLIIHKDGEHGKPDVIRQTESRPEHEKDVLRR